jgi:exopolyphosphatase / guanosine-5'-triphosphate,3'-diphosphate pyrophosphatase
LGGELREHGQIGEAKLTELVAIVRGHVALARRLGASELRAVATDAVRRAANGRRLVREVSDRSGTRIDILTAREEARLAFAGAVGMLETPPCGLIGVLDVGGGSSELVVGECRRPVAWWESVPVGSSSLTDDCLPSDPPAAAEVLVGREHARAAVAAMSPPRPARALAVGGSAASLARVTGPVLDGPAFARALNLLAGGPAAAVGRRLDIDPRRVRLLPAALLLLEAMSSRLGIAPTIGRGGIREGVLLEAARA